MRMLQIIIILLSLLTPSGYGWILQTTHTNVIPRLTDGVQLDCFYQEPYSVGPFIDQLTRIRLVKMDNTSDWDTYAEVILPNINQVILSHPNVPGLTTSGHLGLLNDTFLTVMWSTASVDTVGSYKCELDGFSFDKGNDYHVITRAINITNKEVSTEDLLEIAFQMRRKSDALAKELDAMKEENSVQRQQLSTSIMNKVRFSIEENYLELRYWPMGHYSLLFPSNGCPDTFYSTFQNGNVKIETETDIEPNHNFSSIRHLSLEPFERCGTRNILKFNFCMSTSNDEQLRIPWPKGSYCLGDNSGSCPSGFVFGYRWSILHSKTNLVLLTKNFGNVADFNVKDRIISFRYCCRSDGDVNTSILLPNDKPFYLYRHKGKCQSVLHMEVEGETIDLDTDISKTNKADNSEAYADGSLQDGLIELCYYTKKRQGSL